MNEIIGYAAAALIGISLGLIGGGGSILTVPVLVYLFRIEPVIATSYSLFIVGLTSLVGALNQYRNQYVDTATALLFGSASITTVFLVRKFVVPAIPHTLFRLGRITVTFSMLTMILFALLMLAASFSMIRGGARAEGVPVQDKRKLLLYGVLIGLVTGFLGAGGGFLLIPALVLLVGLPMKKAIGTSLLIIALNSLIGFTGDLGSHPMNWHLLITLSIIAITGIFIGSALGTRLPGQQLKKGFGWFVLAMGIFILVREIL